MASSTTPATGQAVTIRFGKGAKLHAAYRFEGFATAATKCGYRGKAGRVVAEGHEAVTCERCTGH